ncbi:uncharacterized protein LOC144425790 [Styela clava]
MHLLARVMLLIVAAILHQSIGLSQINVDLCSTQFGASVKRAGDIHNIWKLKADSCTSVHSVLLVKITKNNLNQKSQCIGSLQITAGLVDTELCDSKLNDCFLFASKTVSDKSITDGSHKNVQITTTESNTRSPTNEATTASFEQTGVEKITKPTTSSDDFGRKTKKILFISTIVLGILLVIAVIIFIVLTIKMKNNRNTTAIRNNEKPSMKNISKAQFECEHGIYENNTIKQSKTTSSTETSGYELPICHEHSAMTYHPDPRHQIKYLTSDSLQQPDGSSEYEPTNFHLYHDIEY